MSSRTLHVSEPAHATLDALHNEEGKVPNEALKKPRVSRKRNVSIPIHTAVVARKPVRKWTCEACGKRGRNWQTMQEHVKDTGHKYFVGDYSMEELKE